MPVKYSSRVHVKHNVYAYIHLCETLAHVHMKSQYSGRHFTKSGRLSAVNQIKKKKKKTDRLNQYIHGLNFSSLANQIGVTLIFDCLLISAFMAQELARLEHTTVELHIAAKIHYAFIPYTYCYKDT